MKRLFLIPACIAGLFIFQGCEDDDNNLHSGNEAVENAFTAKYADATHVDWGKKGDYWVVDFNKDAKNMEAWFGQNGEWYLTETDLSFDMLPEAVRTAFSAGEYQSWHIDDIDMVERKDMETIYVLEVENGEQEYDLYYSPDGTLIKAVADTDDNDDNEKYLPPSLPDKVNTYISTNYPQAKILEAEMEEGMYEVDIFDGTAYRELLFTSEGDWSSTETQVRKDAVPQNVMDALLASEYASYTIDEIDFYETPQRNYYYFELESPSQDVDLIITLEGAIEVVKVDRD